MIIVEFLTARLDEREENVQLALRTEDYGVSQFDLDDIAAKRAVVKQYERALENCRAHPSDLASKGALLALLGVIKHLSLPYSDHEDYNPEWRP